MSNLKGKNILVTGATGGIGFELCNQLNALGANLVLQGRSVRTLQNLKDDLSTKDKCVVKTIELDLLSKNAAQKLVEEAILALGSLDMLINLAGIQTFQALSTLSDAQITEQLRINLSIPIFLSHAVAAVFSTQGSGTIVNIGSTFGAIGFAQFSVYSASKFGLRGFSEALRRELSRSKIDVLYIAPRATRTSMNIEAVYQMAHKTNTAVDEPEWVARKIIHAIEKKRKTTHLGFPEKLFCKINALFPMIVDKALSGQNKIASQCANPHTKPHHD